MHLLLPFWSGTGRTVGTKQASAEMDILHQQEGSSSKGNLLHGQMRRLPGNVSVRAEYPDSALRVLTVLTDPLQPVAIVCTSAFDVNLLVLKWKEIITKVRGRIFVPCGSERLCGELLKDKWSASEVWNTQHRAYLGAWQILWENTAVPTGKMNAVYLFLTCQGLFKSDAVGFQQYWPNICKERCNVPLNTAFTQNDSS